METVYSSYPAESAMFFRKTKDPFANPVGTTLKKSLSELYDVLGAGSFDPQKARNSLEPIVKLRSVQDLSPTEALGFIFELKTIIGSGIGSGENHTVEEGKGLFSRIDSVMLLAFDLYMENKRKIYTLRASQARDNVRQLLLKKDLICELPEIDPELKK